LTDIDIFNVGTLDLKP